ncbi:uncharacterized protein LOC108345153 [Vigna angularis]|uniref:uncharacterized protein LOC108345153 n=1 Tax=Phaseolus angularis TaxID=3914 RepID=UPI0022B469FE|nr:uncharacterized protein LOC108345153 [Vigna angularis]
MDKEVSEMASLRVRHRVQTQHIVQVNGCLSSFQKERLKSTPFKWLVDMVDDMVISSPILIELISRWQKNARLHNGAVTTYSTTNGV